MAIYKGRECTVVSELEPLDLRCIIVTEGQERIVNRKEVTIFDESELPHPPKSSKEFSWKDRHLAQYGKPTEEEVKENDKRKVVLAKKEQEAKKAEVKKVTL